MIQLMVSEAQLGHDDLVSSECVILTGMVEGDSVVDR